jgi:peptidoglycan/LPS O-acetylase OafA/YrhL
VFHEGFALRLENWMQSKSSQYVNGFDWVRAVMSVAIVIWHMRTFGKSVLFTEEFLKFRINITDVLNFHIMTVAVPVFLLISCYFIARNQTDWPRLRHRVWRLTLLVVFWTVMLSIWKGAYAELRKMIPSSFGDLLVTVFSANGEYYYFFVSLMLCILIAFLFARLSTRWNVAALILSLAWLFFLPQIVMSNYQTVLIAYWNPLNFLAYPFAAILIFRYQDRLLASGRGTILSVMVLLAIGSLFAWYEWTHYVQGLFLSEGVAFPLHTRVSQFFLGTAIIVAGLWPWRMAPAVIRFMSKHSLALYVLHDFFRPIVLQNTPTLGLPDLAVGLVQLILVVLLCYLTSLILVAFIKEDLLR